MNATKFSLESVFIFGMVISIILVVAAHLAFLTVYPPVFIDEPWNANTAWTWLTTGDNFDAIHSGTLDQFGYEWIRRPFIGTAPWVISFALLGLGLFQARLVSWIFGVLLLVATIIVGRRSYDLTTGLLAALVLSLSIPFINSSHWARQEIILVTIVMVAYGLALFAFQQDKWWAHLSAGLLMGLSLDIHQNGSLFILGFAALYLIEFKSKFFRKPGFWLSALGGLIGIAYFAIVHILPSPRVYSTIFSYNFLVSQEPLIFKVSLRNLLSSVDNAIGIYHFYENNLDFALIGASIAYFVFRRSKSDLQLLLFVGLAFISSVLLVGDQVDHYAILLYPFFMLILSATFVSGIKAANGSNSQRIFVFTLLILILFNSALHYLRPVLSNRNYPYYGITERIEQVIPQNKQVMGSPLWWLGLSKYRYSSSLNLTYYHYYNGFTLTQGMEIIKPDVIIVDNIFREQLRKGDDQKESRFYMYPEAEDEFNDILSKYGKNILEFSTPWYGLIQVYVLNWDKGSGG